MKTLAIFFIFCNIQLGLSQSIETTLLNVEEKINSLNCFSYKSAHSSSLPGDTIVYYRYTSYFDVTSNPDDKVFGSRYKACFKDSAKIDLDYHNNLEIRYNWEKKTLRIDTINPQNPFVSLNAPIPYQLKALIRYSLAHKDSVECSFMTYTDSIDR